jgi:hypothetical protein
MVPKMWSGILPEELLIPEPALPAQFHIIWHRSRAISAERALVLAVLWQAVADLQKYRFAARRQQQRLYMEAYEWVASPDHAWPYSFVNLCELLNLNPESLRDELLTSAPVAATASAAELLADVEEAA